MMPSKPEVRCHGTAKSTQQNRRSAKQKLNQYLLEKKLQDKKRSKFDDLTDEEGEQLFCHGLKEFEAIASWLAGLCVTAVRPGDGVAEGVRKANMAIGTAETYFGYIVQVVKDRFHKHSCW